MNFYVWQYFPKDYETDFRMDYLPTEDALLTDDAPRCPVCNSYVDGRQWLPPYNVEKLELWGKGFGDIAFGSGGPIVSERFKALFEEEGLTGLSGFFPVKIEKIKRIRRAKGDPPKYFLVKVASSRAAIDLRASGLERADAKRPLCPECRQDGGITKRIARIILEPGTWSGEDMFIARGLTGTIITSERFKQFCTIHTIKNAVLIPAEQYCFDFYPWEKGEKSSL